MDSPFAVQLFHDVCPSIQALFESKAQDGDLFADTGEPSYVDVRVKSAIEADSKDRSNPTSSDSSSGLWNGWLKERIKDPSRLNALFKPDAAAYRLLFISQVNSWAELRINEELFRTVMQECNVFPKFLDFVLSFGAKSGETEVGPPPMRYRPVWVSGGAQVAGEQEAKLAQPERLELAYGLRFVELNGRSKSLPWSLRQTAIYHQCRRDGSDTWIFMGEFRAAKKRMERYFHHSTDKHCIDPVELHVILLDTSLSNWRSYMIWLSEEIAVQVSCFNPSVLSVIVIHRSIDR